MAEMDAVWALRVSNPRPPRCKRGALATELSALPCLGGTVGRAGAITIGLPCPITGRPGEPIGSPGRWFTVGGGMVGRPCHNNYGGRATTILSDDRSYIENELPQPQVLLALGLLMLKPRLLSSS